MERRASNSGSDLPYQLYETLFRATGLEGAEPLVEGSVLSGSSAIAEGLDGLLPEVLQRFVGLPEEAQEVCDNGLLPLSSEVQD